MDPEAARLKPPSKHRGHQCLLWFTVVVLTLGMLALALHQLIVDPDLNFGSTKFSMEPVSHTGIYHTDGAASSPAFNVTLHARSSYKHRFCSDDDGGAVQAVYSGITIAVGHVPPFCVDPKGSTAMTAAALSGWPAMPVSLRERIEHDRRNGGVELEVDLSFANDIKGLVWVRCRAKLDATSTSTCKSFGLGYICER